MPISMSAPTIIVNVIKGSVKPIPLLSGKRWKLPGEKYLPTKEPFVTPAFQKCCGGATERFDNTWEPVVHPYLDKITDAPEDLETGDLRDEQTARKWILSFPPAFCHTTDRQILSQVLNDYDQETQHFFRWQVSYPAEQLSELVYRKIGIDFGTIRDIQPIERGCIGQIDPCKNHRRQKRRWS